MADVSAGLTSAVFLQGNVLFYAYVFIKMFSYG